MKDGHSDAGPSTTTSSPKESLSPRNDTDSTTGEINSASWVVDSSGFLSPAGPVLKEVLDLVDGVCICSSRQLQSAAEVVPIVFFGTRTLMVGATWQLLTYPRTAQAQSVTSSVLREALCRSWAKAAKENWSPSHLEESLHLPFYTTAAEDASPCLLMFTTPWLQRAPLLKFCHSLHLRFIIDFFGFVCLLCSIWLTWHMLF